MTYSVAAYYTRSEPTIASTDEEIDHFIDDLLAAGLGNSIAKLNIRERPLAPPAFPITS